MSNILSDFAVTPSGRPDKHPFLVFKHNFKTIYFKFRNPLDVGAFKSSTLDKAAGTRLKISYILLSKRIVKRPLGYLMRNLHKFRQGLSSDPLSRRIGSYKSRILGFKLNKLILQRIKRFRRNILTVQNMVIVAVALN